MPASPVRHCNRRAAVDLRNRPATTIPMNEIIPALGSVVDGLSDENYAQSLDFYRFWSDIGQTYYQISSDQVFNDIWNNRAKGSTINIPRCQLTNSAAHLILRFASDAESDRIISPHGPGLQSRLCTRVLREFFSNNLKIVRGIGRPDYADVNLIAHWANLGYVKEATIRNHILQSLISHPTLHEHQAYTLIILFKLAGATLEAYAGPLVVDRCFELLNSYCNHDRGVYSIDPGPVRCKQVRAPCMVEGGYRAKTNFQEIIDLRKRGWEGLPPPPVFTTGKQKSAGTNQRDPAATPVVISLGLPNRDLGLQIPQPLPLEPQIPHSSP